MPTDGSKPTKACDPCTGNTASGPEAPKFDWKAFKAGMKAAYGDGMATKKTRDLLADMGGRGGKGKRGGASVCVACPEGTTANKAHTACE